METTEKRSEEQAMTQVQGIVEMVANLTREGAAWNYAKGKSREEVLAILHGADLSENIAWDPNEAEDELRNQLAELIGNEEISPSDFEWNEDDAQQAIQDDPLSVLVRSGWGNVGEEMKAEEFEILLCTGGPAVRIRGELDEHNEPSRAWVEHQDWGTSWQQIFPSSDELEAVLTYCRQFYFGE